MELSDFDFDLPDGRIALRPASPRSSARLLVAQGDQITDAVVRDLPGYLRPGDRLVLNDTRVLAARLTGVRRRVSDHGSGEAAIQVTLLEPQPDGAWSALVKPLRKLRDGEEIHFGGDAGLVATMLGRAKGQALLSFNLGGDALQDAIEASGAMPLPPYIESKRKADAQDRDDYQTVWARELGAVAAPTASLHFDDEVLAGLAAQGVETTFVTLHVGAGTFLPVTVDNILDHKMHAERGEVTEEAASEINATMQAGGRIIPVGTTALRLIESAAKAPGQIAPWAGATDIFIYPGFRFQIADALMTNFHLPKSTLMMLVSALMGRERILAIYDHALTNDYRFFSYGDASLLIPGEQ